MAELNPMNDVLAKFILGSEERKHITIDFLNSMLEREGDDIIKDLTFQNVEFFSLVYDTKLTRLDVFCILATGEQVDIEIQILNMDDMAERTLYYWAQMYTFSLKVGKNYYEAKPTITLNLLRSKYLPGNNPHSMYALYNPETMHRLTKHLEIHFFELAKFKKNNKPFKEMTKMERWLAFFAGKITKEEAEDMEGAAIQDAFDAMDKFKMDQAEFRAYLNREMAIMDYHSAMRTATRIGLERGLKQGLEQGLEQGKKEMIQNMFKGGLPIEQIESISGLSKEKIMDILKEE